MILNLKNKKTKSIISVFTVLILAVFVFLFFYNSTLAVQWNVNPTSVDISYVDVSDSNNTSGTTICAAYSQSTDGNNTDWNIQAGACGAGITISGTTDVSSSSSIKVAVNGSVQGQTGTISGGTWSITGVTQPAADAIITVWIDDAAVADESTAIGKYSGSGDMTDMVLNKHILSIGGAGDQSPSVAEIITANYDHDDNTRILHTANTATLTVDGGSQHTDETIDILTTDTLTVGTSNILTTTNLTITGSLTSSGNSTYNVSGDWTNNGAFTADTSTVTFDGSATQTIAGSATTTFNDVSTAGTTNTSIGIATNVGGTLVVGNGTILTLAGYAFTVTGTTSVTGTVTTATVATGTKTFTGAVTVNAGGVWNLSGQSPATSFAGGITHDGATFNNGTGAAAFSETQSLAGASSMIFGGTITPASTKTLTNNNTGTVAVSGTGSIVLTGNFTQGAGSTLTLAAVAPFSGAGTFDASVNANTVDYNGAGAQTVKAVSYYHLTLSNGDVKTMTSVTIIGGDLTISGTATMTGNAAFTVTGALNYSSSGSTTLTGSVAISIGKYNQSAGTFIDNANTITVTGTGAGVWTKSGGTFTATGTATFTGSDPGIGASNFNNLIINVSGGGATATLEGVITVANDLTISAGALDVSATDYGITVSGNWDNNGTFTCQEGTVTFDASSGDKTINDNGSEFWNIKFDAAATSWTYTDEGTTAATNSTELTSNVTGTVNFINARTGALPTVTAGTLNVDWYLGVHVVNRNGLGNIDTGADDITISENTGSPASTVFRHNGSSWSAGATSQTTGTNSSGLNPQPNTDGAIKVREYSNIAGARTDYLYNLQIDWQESYGAYDYYEDYGENYITSTLNTSSGHDEIIDSDWHRETPETMNANGGLNDVPTYGSWYIGMLTGLDVTITGTTITFANLNFGNSFTDTASTQTKIGVTTSATNGYIVTAWETQKMTHNDYPAEIDNFNVNSGGDYGDYADPLPWTNNCSTASPNNECGFGFTSSDTTVETANRYNSGAEYAGFPTDSSSPIRVADKDGPILYNSGDADTYSLTTYRISASNIQRPGTYSTTIVYVVTAEY